MRPGDRTMNNELLTIAALVLGQAIWWFRNENGGLFGSYPLRSVATGRLSCRAPAADVPRHHTSSAGIAVTKNLVKQRRGVVATLLPPLCKVFCVIFHCRLFSDRHFAFRELPCAQPSSNRLALDI